MRGGTILVVELLRCALLTLELGAKEKGLKSLCGCGIGFGCCFTPIGPMPEVRLDLRELL